MGQCLVRMIETNSNGPGSGFGGHPVLGNFCAVLGVLSFGVGWVSGGWGFWTSAWIWKRPGTTQAQPEVVDSLGTDHI